MNYQENEHELAELLGEIEHVPGTYPPVYIVDGVLITYDKLERIKVVGESKEEPEPTGNGWTKPFKRLGEAIARLGAKLALIKNRRTSFAPKG